MTNILQDISKYDKNAHIPYPTINYVLQETGEDLVTNYGNSAKAEAFIRQATKTAWNILRQSKIQETASALEYLIATNKDYRQAFLDYVCSFIFDIYTIGADEFFKIQNEEGLLKNSLTTKTKSHIESGLLSAGRINIRYKYREGY